MCVDSRSTISRMCEVRKIVPPRATNDRSRSLIWREATASMPFERLVEEEQPRRRQQRSRERQLLAHAVREVGHQRRAGVLEVHQRRADPRIAASRRRVDAVDLRRRNVSVSCAVSRSNSARSSGTTPMRRLTATGSASGSMPRIAHRAGGRPEQPGQALDGRGLAGAVRSEEAVEAARGHREVDAVHGAEAAEVSREAVCLDREVPRHGRRL